MHDYNDTASYPDSVRATSINVKSCAYMSMIQLAIQTLSEVLGKPSREKNGNSLVFYQRGGTSPPTHLARFGTFPFFFYFFVIALK